MTTLLAIALGLFLFWAFQSYSFAPFRVRILPLYALLVDSGLATPDQLRGAAPGADSVLVRGIRFTVLRVGWQSSEGNLIYWDDFRSFSTELDRDVEIAEIAAPASDMFRRATGIETVSPRLYLDSELGGFTIGIANDLADESRQPIAFFPWPEIGIPHWRGGRASKRKRDRLLTQNGWTREEREPGDPQPFALIHKHVRVEWTYI